MALTRVDLERPIGDEDGVARQQLALHRGLQDVCEMIDEKRFVHASGAVRTYGVVLRVRLLAAACGDHQVAQTFTARSGTDVKRRVRAHTREGQTRSVVTVERGMSCRIQFARTPGPGMATAGLSSVGKSNFSRPD